MSKGRRSRDKGKRGELAWRDMLRGRGFSAVRGGQQGAGGNEMAPDVICPDLADFHVEVKNVERLNWREALAQAVEDAGPARIPYVASTANRKPWVVFLRAEDFLDLVEERETGKEAKAALSLIAKRILRRDPAEGRDPTGLLADILELTAPVAGNER